MHNTKIFKIIATAALAAGVLVSGFTASAASIFMNPSSQTVPDSACRSMWISWQPVFLLAQPVARWISAGTGRYDARFSRTWQRQIPQTVMVCLPVPGTLSVRSFPVLIQPVLDHVSALFVGTVFSGVSGDQPIARLNFTLGTGVSNSLITMDAAAVGGTWSSYDYRRLHQYL